MVHSAIGMLRLQLSPWSSVCLLEFEMLIIRSAKPADEGPLGGKGLAHSRGCRHRVRVASTQTARFSGPGENHGVALGVLLSRRQSFTMRLYRWLRASIFGYALAASLLSSLTAAEDTATAAAHDFDFEIGLWKTHISRLVHPLSGSTAWVEHDGTSVVRKIWNGKANLLELEVTGPSGQIEALSLRLYNPIARQWSLNFSNSSVGLLGQPTVGEFRSGRGEFYDQESFDGRATLVRFVISDIRTDSCHFEQSFSTDGGKTWEVNWIATDTRVTATGMGD